MIPTPHMRALRRLCERLQGSGVNWALTGGLSFALWGLPLEPNDIDVQTDAQGAYEIERLFADCVTKPVRFSSGERIRSHLGVLTVDGVTVEIMGDIRKRLEDGTWEEPVDLRAHREHVRVEGMAVPVLSLEYEREAYRKLGRMDRARLLEAWLQRRAHRASRTAGGKPVDSGGGGAGP